MLNMLKHTFSVTQRMIGVVVSAVVLGGAAFVYAQENINLPIDTDGDGLTDHEERAIYQTFWYEADSDGDGFSDGEEVKTGFSPKQPKLTMKEADTDNDGLNDDWEIKLGTNLMVRDTDGDGHLDGTEVYHGFSPTSDSKEKVEKLIKVDVAAFELSYYQGDIILDTIPISTGAPGYHTPRGDFDMIAKEPTKHYGGPGFDFSYPNTKWNIHFTTDYWRYYIHGAYWHDDFGKKNRSHGCINVHYDDMERLYEWTTEDTNIIVE